MPACMTTTDKKDLYQQEGFKKSRHTLDRKLDAHDRAVYTVMRNIAQSSPTGQFFAKSITFIRLLKEKLGRVTTRQQINRSIAKLQAAGVAVLNKTVKKTRYWTVRHNPLLFISKETLNEKRKGVKKPRKVFFVSNNVPKQGQKCSQIPPADVPIPIDASSSKISKNIVYLEEHSTALKEDLRPKSGSKADDDFSKKTKTKQPVKQPYAEFKKERELKAKKEYEQFIEAKNQEFGDELVSRALKTIEARVQAIVDKGHNIACIYSYKKAALANELKNLSLKPQCQKNKAVEEGNASIQKKNLEWLQSAGNQLKDCFSFSQHGSSIKLTYHGETNNELDLNMDPSLFISTAERFARSVNKALGLQKQNTAPPIQKPSNDEPVKSQETVEAIQKPNDLPFIHKQTNASPIQKSNDSQPIQKPSNAQAAQMQNMLGDLKGMFSTKWGSASY